LAFVEQKVQIVGGEAKEATMSDNSSNFMQGFYSLFIIHVVNTVEAK